MFHLQVFYSADTKCRAESSCEKAASVIPELDALKAQHPGCDRIRVDLDGLVLFTINCAN